MSPDSTIKSDCLTTAHVLETFDVASKYGLRKFLEERFRRKLKIVISKAMLWLSSNSKEDGWIFQDCKDSIYRNTSEILRCVPTFDRFYPEIFHRLVDKLIGISKFHTGCIPYYGTNIIDPLATAQFLLSLDRSNDNNFKAQVNQGIQTLTQFPDLNSLFSSTDSECWSVVLKLCNAGSDSVYLNSSRRTQTDSLINTINKAHSDTDFNSILPKELRWISGIISKRIFAKASNNLDDFGLPVVNEKRHGVYELINKWYLQALQNLNEEEQVLASYIERIKRELGKNAAEEVERAYRLKLICSREKIKQKYFDLTDSLLRASNIQELDTIASQINVDGNSGKL